MNRLAVLISGFGSNLQAIINAIERGQLTDAQIALVVSDQAGVYGLERARRHNTPALHFPYPPRRQGQEARQARDGELAALLQEHNVDWVVLAGWLRVLSAAFLVQFPGRVINVHPALPGQFPGLHAIERAFAAYQNGQIEETGVMVHFVPDEGVDGGPLILSETIPIEPEDSLETLEGRVHAVEHRLLVATLHQVLSVSDVDRF